MIWCMGGIWGVWCVIYAPLVVVCDMGHMCICVHGSKWPLCGTLVLFLFFFSYLCVLFSLPISMHHCIPAPYILLMVSLSSVVTSRAG